MFWPMHTANQLVSLNSALSCRKMRPRLDTVHGPSLLERLYYPESSGYTILEENTKKVLAAGSE
jgi:hypothetical protein